MSWGDSDQSDEEDFPRLCDNRSMLRLCAAMLLLVLFVLGCALAATVAKAAEPDPAQLRAELGRWGFPEGTVRIQGRYATAYNGQSKTPRWTLEHLTAETPKGKPDRTSFFRVDESLPAESRATLEDYAADPIWDRGHSAAGGNYGTTEARQATYLLSNIAPQDRSLNRGLWRRLEEDSRPIHPGVDVWIVTVPIFATAKGTMRIKTIGPHQVWVPTAWGKSVLRLYEGEQRPKRLAAWLLPNEAPKAGSKLSDFEVSVDRLEAESGLDLWSELPDEVERDLEAVTP